MNIKIHKNLTQGTEDTFTIRRFLGQMIKKNFLAKLSYYNRNHLNTAEKFFQ
jgi:hypothetical protein